MVQAIAALEEAKGSASYKAEYDKAYNLALDAMDEGVSTDFATIRAAAATLKETNAQLFDKAVKCMEQAVACLISYEAYK